jgi:hypothetical protein
LRNSGGKLRKVRFYKIYQFLFHWVEQRNLKILSSSILVTEVLQKTKRIEEDIEGLLMNKYVP